MVIEPTARPRLVRRQRSERSALARRHARIADRRVDARRALGRRRALKRFPPISHYKGKQAPSPVTRVGSFSAKRARSISTSSGHSTTTKPLLKALRL